MCKPLVENNEKYRVVNQGKNVKVEEQKQEGDLLIENQGTKKMEIIEVKIKNQKQKKKKTTIKKNMKSFKTSRKDFEDFVSKKPPLLIVACHLGW